MTDEELRIAEANLDLYLAEVISIHEDICADPKRYAEFLALTKLKPEVE